MVPGSGGIWAKGPPVQFWITDASTQNSFGGFVGAVLTASTGSGVGTTTLHFASVPSGVVNGMGVYCRQGNGVVPAGMGRANARWTCPRCLDLLWPVGQMQWKALPKGLLPKS